MNQIIIYTDGACSGNPGPGGAAYIIIEDGQVIQTNSNGYFYTTNNRMEIQAVIIALFRIIIMAKDRQLRNQTIIVRTDSQLVEGTVNKGWKRTKNHDLWDQLFNQLRFLETNFGIAIKIEKVKGHSDDEYNNQVDQLAVTAAKAPTYNDLTNPDEEEKVNISFLINKKDYDKVILEINKVLEPYGAKVTQ